MTDDFCKEFASQQKNTGLGDEHGVAPGKVVLLLFDTDGHSPERMKSSRMKNNFYLSLRLSTYGDMGGRGGRIFAV